MSDNELAKKIQEAVNQKAFMDKYRDKLKVPQGMDIQDIPDEEFRKGMKIPTAPKKSMFSKLAGAARKALGPVSAAASLLDSGEVNPDMFIIENPKAENCTQPVTYGSSTIDYMAGNSCITFHPK